MRYDAIKNLTFYIIAGSESDNHISALKTLVKTLPNDGTQRDDCHNLLLQDSLEAHILFSKSPMTLHKTTSTISAK